MGSRRRAIKSRYRASDSSSAKNGSSTSAASLTTIVSFTVASFIDNGMEAFWSTSNSMFSIAVDAKPLRSSCRS